MKNNNETTKYIQMEDDKRNFVIRSIVNFIETKNRYIQVILLLISVISGTIYGIVPAQIQAIIRYTLVINIFMDVYVLLAKNSIIQNKFDCSGY